MNRKYSFSRYVLVTLTAAVVALMATDRVGAQGPPCPSCVLDWTREDSRINEIHALVGHNDGVTGPQIYVADNSRQVSLLDGSRVGERLTFMPTDMVVYDDGDGPKLYVGGRRSQTKTRI